MGFWERYLATIFKGTRATTFKERVEARKAIRILGAATNEYEEAMKLVKAHMVTKSLRKFNTLLNHFRRAANASYSLIFNVLTQDKAMVGAEMDILKSLELLSTITAKYPKLMKLEANIATEIEGSNKKYGEPSERNQYKNVESIINSTKKDRNTFMATINTILQNRENANWFSTFPIRKAASRQKGDILGLRKIVADIRNVKASFKPELEPKAERELTRDSQELAAYLKDGFYYSHYIKKRDTLLVLKILYDLNSMLEFLEESKRIHNLPAKNTDDLISKIEKIKDKILKDFYSIAQGFRIVITSIEKAERQAEIDIGRFKIAA